MPTPKRPQTATRRPFLTWAAFSSKKINVKIVNIDKWPLFTPNAGRLRAFRSCRGQNGESSAIFFSCGFCLLFFKPLCHTSWGHQQCSKTWPTRATSKTKQCLGQRIGTFETFREFARISGKLCYLQDLKQIYGKKQLPQSQNKIVQICGGPFTTPTHWDLNASLLVEQQKARVF